MNPWRDKRMKTKFKFNIGSFTVNTHQTVTRDNNGEITDVTGIPVEIPTINVEGEVEYTAKEMLELWGVAKTIMEEAPEVATKFAQSLVEEYYKALAVVEPLHKAEREKAKQSAEEFLDELRNR